MIRSRDIKVFKYNPLIYSVNAIVYLRMLGNVTSAYGVVVIDDSALDRTRLFSLFME